MEFEDIIKYITDNLEISITKKIEFGPIEMLEVELSIGGIVISRDSCTLDKD